MFAFGKVYIFNPYGFYMDKTNKSTRPIIVNMKFEALKSFKGEVKEFGTGGAHIVFSTDYLGYEVAIVPIKKINDAKNKRMDRNK